MTTHSPDSIKSAVIWIIASLLVMATAWTLDSTGDLNTRVKVIEDTRFSEADAARLEIELRVEMRDAIDEIKQCLNNIQRGKECE